MAKVPLTEPLARTQGDFLLRHKWILNRQTGQKYNTHSGAGLQTKKCVYVILCSKCGLQYVGETGNTLAVRFYQYKYNILRVKNNTIPVIDHFITHGWSPLKAVVVEADPHWTRGQRRRAEAHWMVLLNTFIPYGLNEKGNII